MPTVSNDTRISADVMFAGLNSRYLPVLLSDCGSVEYLVGRIVRTWQSLLRHI